MFILKLRQTRFSDVLELGLYLLSINFLTINCRDIQPMRFRSTKFLE